MVSIEISEGALKDLKQIDQAISKRIVAKIIWMQQNFTDVVPDRLHYGLREWHKLRIGDYRAIYLIHNDHVVVEAVQHRREAYK